MKPVDTKAQRSLFLFYDSILYAFAYEELQDSERLFQFGPSENDLWGQELINRREWQRFAKTLSESDASKPAIYITSELTGIDFAYLAVTLRQLQGLTDKIYFRPLFRQIRQGQSVHFAEAELAQEMTKPDAFFLLSSSEVESLMLQWDQTKKSEDCHPILINGKLCSASDGALDPLIEEILVEFDLCLDKEEILDLIVYKILNFRLGFGDVFIRKQVVRWLTLHEDQ